MSSDRRLRLTDDSVRTILEGVLEKLDALQGDPIERAEYGVCQLRGREGEILSAHQVAAQMRRMGQPVEQITTVFEFCLHGSEHNPRTCRKANRIAEATRTRVRAEIADGRPIVVTTESIVRLGYLTSSSSGEHLTLFVIRAYEVTTERIIASLAESENAKTATKRVQLIGSDEQLTGVLAEFLAYVV